MDTKQLWSHLLTCFKAYCSHLLSCTKLDTLKLWSEAKPVLSTLESMRKSLCHSQTETFKVLSVLWLQIRLQVGQLCDSVKHIDQDLLPFFQAFNLSMRRYVEGIFLVAFFKNQFKTIRTLFAKHTHIHIERKREGKGIFRTLTTNSTPDFFQRNFHTKVWAKS